VNYNTFVSNAPWYRSVFFLEGFHDSPVWSSSKSNISSGLEERKRKGKVSFLRLCKIKSTSYAPTHIMYHIAYMDNIQLPSNLEKNERIQERKVPSISWYVSLCGTSYCYWLSCLLTVIWPENHQMSDIYVLVLQIVYHLFSYCFFRAVIPKLELNKHFKKISEFCMK